MIFTPILIGLFVALFNKLAKALLISISTELKNTLTISKSPHCVATCAAFNEILNSISYGHSKERYFCWTHFWRNTFELLSDTIFVEL